MGKGSGRSGVSQIVCGHIDGLHGGDGAFLGGGDTLLHETHVDGEGGLVADGRGDTAQQSGDLGTGLGEAEDVIDEK